MLSAVGLATVLTIIVLLVSRKVAPVVALTLVPFVGALVAGFGFEEIGEYFSSGLGAVAHVAAMFIFAISFFGVLQDAGLFKPMVNFLVRVSGGSVVSVAVGTAIIGMLAHLDGAGATTFLLTIPALLPLYRRLGMNPYLMMMLLATGAGIFNLLPWAGPLGRTAAVLELDPVALWYPLIPVQIAGAVLLVIFAAGMGMREHRRIQANGFWQPSNGAQPLEPLEVSDDSTLARPKLLWVNLAILLTVLGALVSGLMPAAYVFMIGLAVAVVINYPSVPEQMARMNAHAPNALLMGAIILSAGSLLGILNGTGMLRSIAADMVVVLPGSVIPHLHLVIGVFGLPLDLLLSTDAYYFALLPVVEQIVSPHGVASTTTAYSLVIGNVIGTFLSPFSPALWLGLGLARLEIGMHLRYSFMPMWIFSLILMGFAAVIGLIPIG
ncbi:MAG: citrate transporter [Gammaproteobacteria bacterium]|nr:citrate transporter [Gammaproteobacteria bacterium]